MTEQPAKDDFDRDGFVVVRQFLPAEELAELTHHLDRYIRDVAPTLPDADAFYQDKTRPATLKQMQHMGQDVFFNEYRQNTRWIDLAQRLLGEPAEAQEPEWFNKPPGTEHPTPPHQDNYYFCLEPPQVLTMWLALDVVDEENGCLRYIPGSHREGLRLHQASKVLGFSQGIHDLSPQEQSRETVVCLKPGDLTIHHGETIHRADPNRSPRRSRRAFAMVVRGKSCRRNETRYAEYLSKMQAQHNAQGLQAS